MLSRLLLLFRLLVWRPFWRAGLRSVFVILGVALGVAVTTAISLANHSALATFRDSLDLVAGRTHVQVLPTGVALPETLVRDLGWLRRLGTVVPVIETPVVTVAKQRPLTVLGLDLLQANPAEAGFEAIEEVERPLFVARKLVDELGLKVGAPLEVVANDRRAIFHIAGIIPDSGDTAAWDSTVVLTDIADAQIAFGRYGELDRLDVVLDQPDTVGDVVAKLQATLPPSAKPMTPERRNGQVQRMLQAFQANLAALSYIALLVGAYLIYNTLSVSVVQRRGEIGTLRALGVTRRQILTAIGAEALLVGTLGSALGLAGGVLLASGAVKAVTRTVNSLYVSTGSAAVYLDGRTLAMSAAVGLGLSLLAAAVPALEAARTPPANAMRVGSWERKQSGRAGLWAALGSTMLGGAYIAALQPPIGGMPVFGYLSAMLIVLGASFLVPLLLVGLSRCGRALGPFAGLTGRLSAVNLGASVGRHAVAVASLMVGLSMILSVAIMIGSFRGTVSDWVGQTLRADLYVSPLAQAGQIDSPVLSEPTLAKLTALPGVAAVGPYRELSVTIGDRLTKLGAGDLHFTARHAPLPFVDPDTRMADVLARVAGQDRVIVSETFANHFKVGPGDTVPVPTPKGPVAMPIEAVYYDYSNEQGIVILDRATFRRHFGDARASSLSIVAAEPAAIESIRSAILTDSELAAAVRVTRSGELREEAMRIFDETFAITYALQVIAMSVALLGVVASLTTLVLERQRELGILRTLGFTRRQIAGLIVGESAWMGVAGSIVGVAAGYALALVLIFVVNKQSFGWSIRLLSPWAHVVQSVAMVMVTAILAGIYPAYRATRLPMAEAVRAE